MCGMSLALCTFLKLLYTMSAPQTKVLDDTSNTTLLMDCKDMINNSIGSLFRDAVVNCFTRKKFLKYDSCTLNCL